MKDNLDSRLEKIEIEIASIHKKLDKILRNTKPTQMQSSVEFDDLLAYAKKKEIVTAADIQRHFSVGYCLANELLDQLTERGFDNLVHHPYDDDM